MNFLPTLERARLEIRDAPERVAEPPTQTLARAAIVLHSSAVQRKLWADDVEMSEKLYARLPRGEIPEAPQPRVLESAYRGTAAVRTPDFHGFEYGDAFARTLEAIETMRHDASIVALENSCFAVPLLWLVYGDAGDAPATSHVVVIAQPDGSLAAVSA
jgi:hypothetical protein